MILLYLPIIFFFFWALFAVFSIVKGAPYVKTPQKRIASIVKMLDLKKDDVAVDLGSGNGDLVLMMARQGTIAHGIELNGILVLISWLKIKLSGLSDRAYVYWGNMWGIDMGEYTVVTVYGFPTIMKDLEKKLLKELPVGARVVSNAFPFPNWKPVKKHQSLYLYIKS